MSKGGKTIYLTESDEDRVKRVAAWMKRKNIQGVYKSDGTVNLSAFVRIASEICERIAKKEQKS